MAVLIGHQEKYPVAEVLWHLLEAKPLLDKDIEEGKHLEVDPQELYESRAEYQQFALVTFHGHLYQEVKRWEKNTSKVCFGRKQKH